MFRKKICGITNSDDALAAVALGADALGLNFYSRSSRFVPVDRAAEIAAAVRTKNPNVELVGVFVNSSLEELQRIAAAVPLDSWQLHGDESPELLTELAAAGGSRKLTRAFRCRGAELSDVSQYLERCQELGRLPDAVLLDAFDPAAFGGTGKVVDWNIVREQRERLFGLPVILAGGLTPENVAAAICTARPDAVDVASGVEGLPGKKDVQKVRAFLENSHQAFAKRFGSEDRS